MNDLIYRKIDINDIDRLVELRSLQLADENDDSKNITEVLFKYFNECLFDNSFHGYACIDQQTIEIISVAGMVYQRVPPHYSNLSGKVGHLCNVYTIPSFRRRGIAKKLLEMLMIDAKNDGYEIIWVSASDMGKKLYESVGFNIKNNFLQKLL